ncbi:toprim domain-containing protein [Paraburkholderia sp. RL17-381-BIF-C]|uniref:toprim domain-containing protein n=1 Tax=Paraburkholderia sp. RL17-381-BIF-C TaxID=3031635 RepID=UPI0038B9824A
MLSDIERARSALFHLDAGCDRAEWIRIGMAAKAADLDVVDWIDWCAAGANYGGEREARAVWRSFASSGGIGAATLFRTALDAGWSNSSPMHHPTPARTRQPQPEREIREVLDPRWMRYWESIGPVRDVGSAYLQARQCAVPPADGDLRFDPAARHPAGYVGPCLVALVTDVASREPISLHRTWINADGTKADVEPPRLLLGGHRKAGGVIRLWPDEALTQGLAIAEGIETALSLARVFQPAWALIDAGNLTKFPVLAGVESLLIAEDHDEAGARAAKACAIAWASEDREVRIAKAPVAGDDANDYLRRAA